MIKLYFLFSLLILNPLLCNAAIYGEDDRVLTFNHNQDQYQHHARSVLAQLRKNTLSYADGSFYLKTKPLHEHVTNLCLDAPFAQTSTFARCTAFLVAPNLLVTAGHCINSQQECDEAKWVFTSDIDPHEINQSIVKEDIVTCRKLIAHRKNSISKNDYALIEIEEKIHHRPSLKYRKNEKVSENSSFYVIGHPTGLPLIVTDHAQVLDNRNEVLFKINSDTFGGNSGSPVINSKTGLVEGILTDGDLDYTLDKAKGCMMPYLCPTSKCKGENVVRITNIELLAPEMEPLIDPIFNPRTPRL